MIHHIKNYRLIIIVLFALLNLSCKNEVANSKTLSIDSTKTIQKIKSIEKIADTSKIKLNVNAINWIFNKVVPISNTYSCESKKYENLKFSMSKDSVFINGIYTDNVYRGVIKSENYFSQKYLYNVYKNILPEKFNVKLPQSIENIRNKRANEKDSKLDAFFQDAFFVDDLMFFEKSGCIYCFKKENKKIIQSKNILLPVSKKEMLNENYIFSPIESKLIIDGNLASGEYKINKDISILWFDGDIEKWFIVTLLNNKVYQKLLIVKSETIELKNGEKQDNFIDFYITKELKIKLEYSINYKTLKKINEENYSITKDMKIIKK